MKRRTLNDAVYGGIAGLSVLLAHLSACSSDTNDTPGQNTVVTGGSAGVGGSGKGGANGKGGSGATGGEDSQGGEGGSGNENAGGQAGNGPVDNECEPELSGDDCWTCPEQPEQWLNQCSSAQCAAFVNDKAHLPLLNDDGTLPPLP
jgi:hypothetical protein